MFHRKFIAETKSRITVEMRGTIKVGRFRNHLQIVQAVHHQGIYPSHRLFFFISLKFRQTKVEAQIHLSDGVKNVRAEGNVQVTKSEKMYKVSGTIEPSTDFSIRIEPLVQYK